MNLRDIDIDASALREIKERQIHSLPTLILRQLRHMIFTGQIHPGEKVKESVIAARLLVSRGSVREACRQLVEAGVLENFPQRGNFVRVIALEEAEELFEVRAQLFELVGRLAAQRITPQQIDDLTAMVDDMDEINASGDIEAIFPSNLKFNQAVLDIAGNKKLKDLYLDIFYQLRLFRLQSLDQTKRFSDFALAYHKEGNQGRREVIAALKAGNADQAGELFRKRVMASCERSLRVYREMKKTESTLPSLVA